MLAHPRVVRGLTAVIGPNVKAMQSMLFIKSGGQARSGLAPGRVLHPHLGPLADRGVDRLDDATVENGCLWVLPGSSAGDPVSDARAERPAVRLHDRGLRLPYADADAVPVEIPAGTALFFNGYLLHRSLENPAGTATVERWPTTT